MARKKPVPLDDIAAALEGQKKRQAKHNANGTMVVVEERRAAILSMMQQHVPNAVIREKFGVTDMQIQNEYRLALADAKRRRMEIADTLLDDQLLRVHHVLSNLETGLAAGDAKTAAVYLEALDQRARLMNLYPAPEKLGSGHTTAIQITWNATLPAAQPALTDGLTVTVEPSADEHMQQRNGHDADYDDLPDDDERAIPDDESG